MSDGKHAVQGARCIYVRSKFCLPGAENVAAAFGSCLELLVWSGAELTQQPPLAPRLRRLELDADAVGRSTLYESAVERHVLL